MGRLCCAILGALLVMNGMAAGQLGPVPNVAMRNSSSALAAGDAPLSELETLVGQYNVKTLVVPHNGQADPVGTFTVSGLPIGSTIERAWFFATSFGSDVTESADAVFAGTAIGSRTPDAESAAGYLPGQILYSRLYQYDVSSLVTEPGDYEYAVAGPSNCFGDALVVVYSNPTFPIRQLTILSGAENLLNDETFFSVLGLESGLARLSLFSVADEVGGLDSIDLNGLPFVGPEDLFQANRGNYASLVDLRPTLAGGTNTFRVETSDDWLGLHLAIAVSAFECAASWQNYGQSLAGTFGEPILQSTLDPVLGDDIEIVMSNSRGADTAALMILGFDEASIPTQKQGTLLVDPFLYLPMALPAAGFTYQFAVPEDLAFCGFSVYLQSLICDPGAIAGLAFSRGLELHLGTE